MNEKIIRFFAVTGIIAVAFSVIAFAAPFQRNSVFWLAYIFGLISIAAQLYIQPKAFASKDARSKFYGFPLARIGVYYFIVQIALSLIFMSLAALLPVWIPAVICIILLAVAMIGFVSADAVRDEVERLDVQVKRCVGVMRSLQSKAASLVGQCENEDAKKSLQQLSEAFRFSDPVSSASTETIEADLSSYLDDIQTALVEQDYANASALCDKAMPVLMERNRICKLEK